MAGQGRSCNNGAVLCPLEATPIIIIIIIIIIMGICSGTSTEWLFVHCSRSNWNLAVLIFAEGGKPENPEKNPRSEDENQQQTQPTYGTGPESNPGHIGGRRVLSPLCHPPS